MTKDPVLVFHIITPYVPLEIIGTVCGIPFYYRGRHEKWSIYKTPIAFIEREPLAQGNSDKDQDLSAAIQRILSAFKETLEQEMYGED